MWRLWRPLVSVPSITPTVFTFFKDVFCSFSWSEKGNETLRCDAAFPAQNSQNPLLVHRLDLGQDVARLQTETTPGSVSLLFFNYIFWNFFCLN